MNTPTRQVRQRAWAKSLEDTAPRVPNLPPLTFLETAHGRTDQGFLASSAQEIIEIGLNS